MRCHLLFLIPLSIFNVSPLWALPTIEVGKVCSPPQIDGEIQEECWQKARPLSGFISYFPTPGVTPKESTQVKILYDPRALYIGFLCFDRQPDKIDIRQTHRDFDSPGDMVEVILDTFRDQRTGYRFIVNAAGVQADNHLENDGQINDPTWDGVWFSAAKIKSWGWSAEIAIPFHILRFKPGAQTWGINFSRFVTHENEYSFYAPLSGDDPWVKLSRCALLVGLEDIRVRRNWDILPSILTRFDRSLSSPERTRHWQLGLDTKIELLTNLVTDITLNPDFGQVEADPNQVNLSRYELFLEERRPFFVEKADFFQTPLRLFYSRRIGRRLPDGTEVAILAGGKITGKVKGLTLAALTVETPRTDYSSPGYFASEPQSNYSVIRLSQDIFTRSHLGVILTNAQQTGEYQRVAGFDAHLDLGEGFLASGQLAQSFSPHQGSRNTAAQVKFSKYADAYNFGLSYRDIGPGFADEKLGYVPWVGNRSNTLAVNFTPRLNCAGIRKVYLGLGCNQSKDHTDPQWSSNLTPSFSLELVNNWWFSVSQNTFHLFYQETSQTGQTSALSLSTDSNKPLSFASSYSQGDFYNYQSQYFGQLRFALVSTTLKPVPPLYLSASTSLLRQYFPDQRLDQQIWLHSGRVVLSLTNRLSIRLFAQGWFSAGYDSWQTNALLAQDLSEGKRLYIGFLGTQARQAGHSGWERWETTLLGKLGWRFGL